MVALSPAGDYLELEQEPIGVYGPPCPYGCRFAFYGVALVLLVWTASLPHSFVANAL